MNQTSIRLALLSGVAVCALVAGHPETASAQMYSSGPGFYLSAEGRYLMNEGGKVSNFNRDEYPAATTPVVRQRAEDGWGGKLMLGYRFTNNWDIGVGLSGGWLKGKKSDSATTTTTPFQGLPPSGGPHLGGFVESGSGGAPITDASSKVCRRGFSRSCADCGRGWPTARDLSSPFS